jgi:hypothetical protein
MNDIEVQEGEILSNKPIWERWNLLILLSIILSFVALIFFAVWLWTQKGHFFFVSQAFFGLGILSVSIYLVKECVESCKKR